MTDTEKRLFGMLISMLLAVCAALGGASAWYMRTLTKEVAAARTDYTEMKIELHQALDRIEAVARTVPLPSVEEDEP